MCRDGWWRGGGCDEGVCIKKGYKCNLHFHVPMGESATREGDFFDSFLPHVRRTRLIPYGGVDLEVQIERDELQ